jgi:ribosomal protein L29
MKQINAKDLRSKTDKELSDILAKTVAEIKKVSESVLRGEEKDFSKPRKMRKDLARIKTVLKEKLEVKNA